VLLWNAFVGKTSAPRTVQRCAVPHSYCKIIFDGEETAIHLIPLFGRRVWIPYILSDTRRILGLQTSVVALRNAREVRVKCKSGVNCLVSCLQLSTNIPLLASLVFPPSVSISHHKNLT